MTERLARCLSAQATVTQPHATQEKWSVIGRNTYVFNLCSRARILPVSNDRLIADVLRPYGVTGLRAVLRAQHRRFQPMVTGEGVVSVASDRLIADVLRPYGVTGLRGCGRC